jgi:hypothetical protein
MISQKSTFVNKFFQIFADIFRVQINKLRRGVRCEKLFPYIDLDNSFFFIIVAQNLMTIREDNPADKLSGGGGFDDGVVVCPVTGGLGSGGNLFVSLPSPSQTHLRLRKSGQFLQIK